MKPLINLTLMTLMVASSVAAEPSCDEIASEMKESISKEPSSLLALVSEFVTKHPGCACEIVKAASTAADNDNSLIGEIVAVAVNSAPAKTAEIAECAIATAPGAAGEIKSALEETFEGAKAPINASKQAIDGKEPIYSAKEIVVTDDGDDFAPAPRPVSGVYLIAPIAPASGLNDRERLARQLGVSTRELDRILRNGGKTLVDVLKRRPRRDRERDPRDDSTPSQQTP